MSLITDYENHIINHNQGLMTNPSTREPYYLHYLFKEGKVFIKDLGDNVSCLDDRESYNRTYQSFDERIIESFCHPAYILEGIYRNNKPELALFNQFYEEVGAGLVRVPKFTSRIIYLVNHVARSEVIHEIFRRKVYASWSTQSTTAQTLGLRAACREEIKQIFSNHANLINYLRSTIEAHDYIDEMYASYESENDNAEEELAEYQQSVIDFYQPNNMMNTIDYPNEEEFSGEQRTIISLLGQLWDMFSKISFLDGDLRDKTQLIRYFYAWSLSRRTVIDTNSLRIE